MRLLACICLGEKGIRIPSACAVGDIVRASVTMIGRRDITQRCGLWHAFLRISTL